MTEQDCSCEKVQELTEQLIEQKIRIHELEYRYARLQKMCNNTNTHLVREVIKYFTENGNKNGW